MRTRARGSAAAGRANDPGAGGRIVDLADGAAAQHGTEVDDVPRAPPRDQGGDPERPEPPALPVEHPGALDVPVADGVVAGAWRDPAGLARRDDDPYEPGSAGRRAEQVVRSGDIEPEVCVQPVVPVSGRIRDRFH